MFKKIATFIAALALMQCFYTAVNAAGASSYGWKNTRAGMTYVYKDGTKAVGFKRIGKDCYYFTSKGIRYMGLTGIKLSNGTVKYGFFIPKLTSGIFDINGKNYYFSPYMTTGMVKIDGSVYYFNKYMKTGFQTVNGKKYYFGADGVRVTGLKKIGGYTYYMNPYVRTGWCVINKNAYYFDKNGRMVTGWQTINGKRYYFNKSGIRQSGFQKIDGKTYCLKSAMLTGWQKLGNYYYNFGTDGAMKTGFSTVSGKVYYFTSTGKRVTGFVTIGKYKYYLNSDRKTGFQKIGTKIYCFDNAGRMLTDSRSVKSKYYYFGTDGAMKTGLQTVNGKTYFYGSNGVMKTGIVTVNGKNYLFDSDRKTGFYTAKNGKKYYLGTDGSISSGAVCVDGKNYYTDPDGALHTGVLELLGTLYYYSADGIMQMGYLTDGDKNYFFSEDGSGYEINFDEKLTLSVSPADNPGLCGEAITFADDGTHTLKSSLHTSLRAAGDIVYSVSYNSGTVSKVSVGGKEVSNGKVTLPYSKTSDIMIYKKDGSAYPFKSVLCETGLPTISINTENSVGITSTEDYVSADFEAFGGSVDYAADIESTPVSIKGRGNTSWDWADKKSYRLKFDSKVKMFDLGKAKSWTLIANYFDKSLMRNYLAYSLADSMHNEFEPRMRYVDLYLNGEYMGTYCVCDHLQINKIRLNLDESTDADTGFFMEIDSRFKEEGGVIGVDGVTFEGLTVALKDPDGASTEQVQFLQSYLDTVTQKLDATDPTLWDYVDMDSFVDWMLVNELFKNYDATFYKSCYMYKNKGSKLFMGPVWDFDIAAGNNCYSDCLYPERWWVTTCDVGKKFFKYPEFKQAFIERWNSLAEKTLPDILASIDETYETVKLSAELNFDRWKIMGIYVWPNPENIVHTKTFKGQCDIVANFLTRRIDWISANISSVGD